MVFKVWAKVLKEAQATLDLEKNKKNLDRLFKGTLNFMLLNTAYVAVV